MNLIFFLLSALFLVANSSTVRAEKALETPLAQRLIQSVPAESPFRVVLRESGQVAVEAGSIFTEGQVGEGLTLPKLISNPKAIKLPSWTAEESWKGTVVIALSVREDGTVGETLVMTSSGNEKLDSLAEETVHTWRFEPAMKDGKPVLECIQIPITFEPKA